MFPQKMIWSCMFSPTAGRSSWTGMLAASKVARAPMPLSSRTCGDLTVLLKNPISMMSKIGREGDHYLNPGPTLHRG